MQLSKELMSAIGLHSCMLHRLSIACKHNMKNSKTLCKQDTRDHLNDLFREVVGKTITYEAFRS